jgi:hypothetical protein
MGRTQEPGGDYGYDEAHQDVSGEADRPSDARREEPPAQAQQDSAGDLGYDEAHDF